MSSNDESTGIFSIASPLFRKSSLAGLAASWLGRKKRSTRRRAASHGLRIESLENRVLLHGGTDEPHDHDPVEGHTHPQLTIIIDGQQTDIPGDIGLDASGHLGFIHTHVGYTSGRLHLEKFNDQWPTEPLTLGDFFDTWRTNGGLAGDNPDAILSDTQIFNNFVDANNTLRMFVNDIETTQFENYVMHDGDNIVLSFAEAGSDAPTFAPIEDVTLLSGAPLHIALNGLDPNGQAITYTATSDSALVSTFIPEGNRSMKISVEGFGDMTFELFEGRAPRVTENIIRVGRLRWRDLSPCYRRLHDPGR